MTHQELIHNPITLIYQLLSFLHITFRAHTYFCSMVALNHNMHAILNSIGAILITIMPYFCVCM